MEIFIYLLLILTAGAAIFTAWKINSQKDSVFDEGNLIQIKDLQASLRNSEMEVARLQERLLLLEEKSLK